MQAVLADRERGLVLADALDEVVVSIIENYQGADGTIEVPDVLPPYVGTDAIT